MVSALKDLYLFSWETIVWCHQCYEVISSTILLLLNPVERFQLPPVGGRPTFKSHPGVILVHILFVVGGTGWSSLICEAALQCSECPRKDRTEKSSRCKWPTFPAAFITTIQRGGLLPQLCLCNPIDTVYCSGGTQTERGRTVSCQPARLAQSGMV